MSEKTEEAIAASLLSMMAGLMTQMEMFGVAVKFHEEQAKAARECVDGLGKIEDVPAGPIRMAQEAMARAMHELECCQQATANALRQVRARVCDLDSAVRLITSSVTTGAADE